MHCRSACRQKHLFTVCMHVHMTNSSSLCVCACVRACVRACMHACVCGVHPSIHECVVCVCMCSCVRACIHLMVTHCLMVVAVAYEVNAILRLFSDATVKYKRTNTFSHFNLTITTGMKHAVKCQQYHPTTCKLTMF